MEKNFNKSNAVVNENADKRTYPFTGKITMSSFVDNQNNERSFVRVVMLNPFAEEELSDVTLDCMFDRDKGILELKAKKALKSVEEIPCSGYFTPSSYVGRDKKTRNAVNIFLKNPFFAGDIKMRIKNDAHKSAIDYLMSTIWDIDFTSYYGLEETADSVIDEKAD